MNNLTVVQAPLMLGCHQNGDRSDVSNMVGEISHTKEPRRRKVETEGGKIKPRKGTGMVAGATTVSYPPSQTCFPNTGPLRFVPAILVAHT